ncbi:MAG TPA: hypothetical protein VK610_05350, partial [Rhodothermales bacterium]|nr:hypothetical protein [Rhodothermales bacterium]
VSGASGVTLEAGVSDGRGRIRYARERNASVFALTLSTPAAEDGPTTFGTLEGLASDLKLAGSYTRHFSGARRVNLGLVQRRQDAICQSVGIDLATESCNDNLVRERGGKEAQVLFLTTALLSPRIWTVTVEGTGGYRRFEYLVAEEDTTVETPYLSGSASVTAGLISPFAFTYVQVRYENTLDAADPVERCVASSGVYQSCEDIALGAPERAGELVLAMGRRFFVGRVALDPQVSIRLTDGLVGASLPIYLVRNGDGLFTGGVRFGWESDERDFAASVFVSAPLSLGPP